MELIDEEGNLFGVVNVIDALVVLLVLAVVVAGASLVLSSDDDPSRIDGNGAATTDSQSEMRYATFDLGQQPQHIASQMAVGDRSISNASGNLTVTDLFVTPADGDQARVIARVELNGTMTGEPPDRQFTFAGDRVRAGDELTIQTAEYDATGRVTNLSPDGTELSTEETSVRLEMSLSADVASFVEAGDTVQIGDHSVATVDEVEIAPTDDIDTRHVFLGATLETYRDNGRPTFANTDVIVGSTVPVETDAYTIHPRIIRVGDLSPLGEVTDTDVTIALDDVRPDVADGIRVGMTETYDGTTYARITEKRTEPASVVLTSDDGNIYLREHPVNQDVTLDATLRTRQTDTGLVFHGESLREGDRITLDLGSITVRGTVVDLDA